MVSGNIVPLPILVIEIPRVFAQSYISLSGNEVTKVNYKAWNRD